MAAAGHAGIGDCEAVVAGALGAWQPANTVSSLAFVGAGAWLLREALRRPGGQADRRLALAAGAALVAVGLGSAAFHGPGTPAGRWAHDASIAALLVVVLAADLEVLLRRDRPWQLAPVAVAAAAGVLVVAPGTAVPLSAVLAVAVAAAEVSVARRAAASSWRHRLAVTCLGGAAVVGALSRSGGPWCRPEALLQGHAVWHVGAAVAVAAWGAAALRRRAGATEPGDAPVSDRRPG